MLESIQFQDFCLELEPWVLENLEDQELPGVNRFTEILLINRD